MTLHRLKSITIGVPDVGAVSNYYTEFGLSTSDGVNFSTVDGGEQLMIQETPTRRPVGAVVLVDSRDDLLRSNEALINAGHHPELDGDTLTVREPLTNILVTLEVGARLLQVPSQAEVMNRPGNAHRAGERAPAVLRDEPVKPRKLGHFVVTSPDYVATASFFSDLIGFKISDYIAGAGVFLRCSTDHHNILVLKAPAVYLHHTAWEVNDVDEVGRGGAAMIEGHPERDVWGLGRHHAGSNFFWYLRDPAGNYSEYYADLDFIPEDVVWEPQSLAGHLGLYNWGPPVPEKFLRPEDLPDLMASQGVSSNLA
jgi:hypothetical protein